MEDWIPVFLLFLFDKKIMKTWQKLWSSVVEFSIGKNASKMFRSDLFMLLFLLVSFDKKTIFSSYFFTLVSRISTNM